MNNHYSFIGGAEGPWQVTAFQAIAGQPLEPVPRVKVVNLPSTQLAERGTWVLQGFTSNIRYAQRDEIGQLRQKQEGLGRPASRCAALNPEDSPRVRHLLHQADRERANGIHYAFDVPS